ncbi:MAG: phosphotransferase [Firmicutes bacterium]|nr:phosphotransferase [Bacillota bacterium]
MHDPDVRNLVQQMAPGSQTTDLGGTMSLNLRVEPNDWVLRIHQPFVSKHRLRAIQALRFGCRKQGLRLPEPVERNRSPILRCRNRWAELEEYVPHERLPPNFHAYTWLFHAMGILHRTLVALELTVPRPVIATYGTPSTLRRWQQYTEASLQGDAEATDIANRLRDLVCELRRRWVSSSEIPRQLVHGDVRLSNVCSTVGDVPVFFDFGFAAQRPRVHDLAYALAFMFLAQRGHEALPTDPWHDVEPLVSTYESACGSPLTAWERKALPSYMAAVPLYQVAIAAWSHDAAQQLREKQHFLQLGEWILAHPGVLMG